MQGPFGACMLSKSSALYPLITYIALAMIIPAFEDLSGDFGVTLDRIAYLV